jgi:hypothetical protein
MSVAFVKSIENFLHGLLSDIDTAIEPGVAYIKANVPAAAITIGEGILAAAATGTPWAALVATLVTQAEASGITIAEQAAKVALNAAQNNLIANGTPHLVAPAA